MTRQAHLPAHLRPLQDPVRTAAGVRAEAAKHFQFLVEYPMSLPNERTPEQAVQMQGMGFAMVDAILAVPVGELFALHTWTQAQGYPESVQELAFDLVPYLTGSLRLLEMEFVHETLGVLPFSVVREVLLATESPFDYQGVALTTDTVMLQYRRLPLNTEVIY